MRGKILNITRDILNNGIQITLNVHDVSVQQLQTISQFDDLDIDLKKHREKRSLDSNAYAWVLISKIAAIVNSSKEEVYEEMLRKYGALAQDDNGYITVTVKDYVDMNKIEGHWLFIKERQGFKSYAMIAGSSEYDTLQMSKFIDGVVSEARELGIDTATPAEIQRMKEQWGHETMVKPTR